MLPTMNDNTPPLRRKHTGKVTLSCVNDNAPRPSHEDAVAEMMELIGLMLADSPYPVSIEDLPEPAVQRPSAA
jgi:hypothetical protein